MVKIDSTSFVSPNRGGALKSYKYIVLHHTATPGNGEGAAGYLCKPAAQASANFVVCKNGTIYQLVPAGYVSWHAGAGSGFGIPNDSMNNYSIGIEIVNLGDGYDIYPEAQLNALDELIAWFDAQWGAVPIIDHKMWAPRRKVDMSANFPLAEYIKNRRHKPLTPSNQLFLAHMDAEAAMRLAAVATQEGYAAWVEGAGQFFVGAINTRDALRYIGEQEKSVSEKFTGGANTQYAVIAIHAAAAWIDKIAVPFATSRGAANIAYNVGDGANGKSNMTSALVDFLINGNKKM